MNVDHESFRPVYPAFLPPSALKFDWSLGSTDLQTSCSPTRRCSAALWRSGRRDLREVTRRSEGSEWNRTKKYALRPLKYWLGTQHSSCASFTTVPCYNPSGAVIKLKKTVDSETTFCLSGANSVLILTILRPAEQPVALVPTTNPTSQDKRLSNLFTLVDRDQSCRMW